MIILEKASKKKEKLDIKNINKINLVKVANMLTLSNFDSKYKQVINNININIQKIKTNQYKKIPKHIVGIKKKVNK